MESYCEGTWVLNILYTMRITVVVRGGQRIFFVSTGLYLQSDMMDIYEINDEYTGTVI